MRIFARPFVIRAAVSLGALLAFTGTASAANSVAGAWKLNLGKSSCEISMRDDGTLTPSPDCMLGVHLAHWKDTSDGIQLQTASGETYAVLKARDGAYSGVTFADMRVLTLSR